MKAIKRMLGAAILAGTAMTAPAEAAVVTRAFTLTASQFTSFNGTPSPVTSLNASFQLTYDDRANGYLGAPYRFVAVTNAGINAGPFSAAPEFGLFQANGLSSFPRLVLGGAVNGTNVMLPNTDDFFFSFDASATGTTRAMLSFSTASGPAFIGSDATVTEVAVGGVPEPMIWAMLVGGFGAVGAAVRRGGRVRRRAMALA